ncbi:MAG: pyridoxal-phosphate dependent enzyme [Proteobacteria bacterium]|nr:pyridoxal-phosphate dependent enzyme [Pseudomonadota bacterium]
MPRQPVRYLNPRTGRTWPVEEALWRAPDDRGYLNLTPGAGLERGAIDTGARSLWRYAAAIPVAGAPAASLGEGWTPLVPIRWEGAGFLAKLDFLMPSGSFKDRGTAVMLRYLKGRGIGRVLEDSSGNAGASLATYAAAAGVSCRILVPAATPKAKIVQMAAAGAEVVPVAGTRQQVAEAALAEAERVFYASHNWQPFFLEGTKTLAFELWEQLGFEVPDNVIVPLGYGSNVIGLHLGFAELKSAGEIARGPRIFGVQAAACAPLVAAFAAGAEGLVPCEIGPTVAEGIASSKPVRVGESLRAARESGGALVSVSEEEIVSALRRLARRGLYVEPTSATAIAAFDALRAGGRIGGRERTVVVLTGIGLKASEKIGALLGLAGA